MKVLVKMLSSLMEYLPKGVNSNVVELSVENSASAHSVVDQLGVPRKDIKAIIINGEFSPEEARDIPLKDGDTITVWPSIQGG